jgi:hypothetical protein
MWIAERGIGPEDAVSPAFGAGLAIQKDASSRRND